jgi:uncharacterized protein (TIGR02118 family)
MIRSVSFIQRRPDLDRADFRRYYEEKHAPLARPHLAGLRHYVRNHILFEHRGEHAADVPFDAISEFEYEDHAAFEAMLAMLAGPIGERIRADELNFMHKPGNSYFGAQRSVIGRSARPAPGAQPKAIALLRRAALAERAAAVGSDLLTGGSAGCVELDVGQPGDPLGAPAWEVVLHVWLDRAATPETALPELAARLTGPGSLRCLWVAEHGEPFPLDPKEARA